MLEMGQKPCVGLLRVPHTPMGRAGTPPYNPTYWDIPNGIKGSYGGVRDLVFGSVGRTQLLWGPALWVPLTTP